MWRGGRDRECPPDSRGCLGTGRGVNGLDSEWEQEVLEKSSPCELWDKVMCSGFFRFKAFTLFLSLSFVGERPLASCFRSRISRRSLEMILSLSSARDVVDEYFKLRRAFPLLELCELSSFDVAHRSVLPNDLSLGLVCCDEATTEAPSAVAPSESLYDASVRHEGLYDVSVRHEGLYDVSEEIF